MQEFTSHLDSKGVQHEVLHDLTMVPDVFYGLSLKLSDESDLEHLESSVHVEVSLLH